MTLPRWMGVAGLPWHYSAVQLHLHWGNGVGVATGSEHTIDGQSSSAEVCACLPLSAFGNQLVNEMQI